MKWLECAPFVKMNFVWIDYDKWKCCDRIFICSQSISHLANKERGNHFQIP